MENVREQLTKSNRKDVRKRERGEARRKERERAGRACRLTENSCRKLSVTGLNSQLFSYAY